MKPKQKRDRLFKRGKPYIRPISIMLDDGYGKDMAILWASYKEKSFPVMSDDLSQEEFAEFILNITNDYNKGWIIEDKNSKFKDGYGPIGMMVAVYNGYELEPHYEPFSWSTSRNTLGAIVSFLQMMRYDKTVGIVNVYSLNENKSFFDKVTEYDVLKYATCIPKADMGKDRYIYYIHGAGSKKRIDHGRHN